MASSTSLYRGDRRYPQSGVSRESNHEIKPYAGYDEPFFTSMLFRINEVFSPNMIGQLVQYAKTMGHQASC
ncbi:hypothetical protein [Changpingibacter yushuensis]|uniref:hypothetical protein n=1 Tax=Changpingibacter yushuensis TaxID=2758440 RepID=UPI0015F5985D|nr:hypothetical protein [Changpingibacter yushuensis]